ncbi:hypothetical protein OYT1_ch2083 [Ferriphaselus amnicola]|uniref:DUF3619 family protein n=1 Tax=Ferriphaselus amnicola TaxID=1188319 RepID=A0A2Z6GDI8_9PROT|nr:DUF3619 family protein [Ferriphaselus amnicola]BBE51608.1 hypothetical protein OYT1_ch2083 [Ferriphaselus amnicola]
MNNDFNIDSVKRLLNRSLTQLDQPTLVRLSEARQRALTAHTEDIRIPVLAESRGNTASHSEHSHHRLQQWGLILLLALGMFSCVTYWEQLSAPSDDEVDIAILIDDLPVEMYAD